MISGHAAGRTGREDSDLDRRYGRVGILAVAAALPYQSDAKNSAYAPVEVLVDDRFLSGSN